MAHLGRRGASTAGLVLALLTLGVQPAFATFHDVLIREVYAGSSGQPDSRYVELQMFEQGQNFVAGHSIDFFDATGASVDSVPFPSEVPGGADQSTLLAATPAAEAEFGIAADVGFAPGLLSPAGGAVCWESLDCVAWGSFAGPTPSPVGQPAVPAGIPAGMALRRTIAPGCPTLLESSDDHNNSAADFSVVFPGPRPNSVKPSEHACESSAGGAGAGGKVGSGPQSQSGRPPRTTLERKPAKRTRDRTPTFRFDSNEAKARFECKLDGGRFKSCRSPFTTRRLQLGRHSFKVRARDSSGKADPSPAAYSFKVIPRDVSREK